MLFFYPLFNIDEKEVVDCFLLIMKVSVLTFKVSFNTKAKEPHVHDSIEKRIAF